MHTVRGKARQAIGALAGVLAVIAVLVVALAPPTLAASDTAPQWPARIQLANDFTFFPPDSPVGQEWVVLSMTVPLNAGETRRISNRMDLTISSEEGAEVDNIIECRGSNGEQAAQAASNGTNHTGSAAGHLVLSASLLFTAPATDTYTCLLRTSTGDDERFDYYVTAHAGTWPNGTWMQLDNRENLPAHGWHNGPCQSNGRLPRPEEGLPPVPDPNCVYLGSPGDPTTTKVFQDKTTPSFWTAPNNATTLSAVAHIQVTSCTSDTSSCDPSKWGYGGIFGTPLNRDHEAFIQGRLEVIQLDPAGRPCKTTSTPTYNYTITNDAHHLPIAYQLDVPISPTCGGSRTFTMQAIINWLSRNPVKVDGSSDYRSAANANMIVSWVNTPTTVPELYRMHESAVTDALTRAGLVLGNVTRVINGAPVGTVIAQNSPARTIEPAGSAVDLTISRGSATVPNVYGRPEAEAKATITAAGLVYSVSKDNACIDPGRVLSVSPDPGTVMAPGGHVYLIVDSSTFKGCDVIK